MHSAPKFICKRNRGGKRRKWTERINAEPENELERRNAETSPDCLVRVSAVVLFVLMKINSFFKLDTTQQKFREGSEIPTEMMLGLYEGGSSPLSTRKGMLEV